MTRWLWTCRAGFESAVAQEVGGGRVPAPALVESSSKRAVWPVFARAGFQCDAECDASVEATTTALCAALDRTFAKRPRAWLLQAWVPDSDQSNPFSAQADQLAEQVIAQIAKTRPDLELRRVSAAEVAQSGGVLAQLCLVDASHALVGIVNANDAPTLAPGGRARSHAPKDAPSRAARKLTEAFEWMGRGPEPGDLCVDLGAAPGGWTAVLLARRARVLAVDPALLAPELSRRRGVMHAKVSAFDFAPDEPVDWLFCDMAWRPLEVASLLAKWGRRRWASTLVSNIKLPMRQRVEFAQRVMKIVSDGGWRDVRGRHLYHDREEFTLAGWRVG